MGGFWEPLQDGGSKLLHHGQLAPVGHVLFSDTAFTPTWEKPPREEFLPGSVLGCHEADSFRSVFTWYVQTKPEGWIKRDV